uniref:Uncharacterized protein n=1 Tax=viral metagenome TaxID=1070528 RepID=A0A6M3L535_9ZZZZ
MCKNRRLIYSLFLVGVLAFAGCEAFDGVTANMDPIQGKVLVTAPTDAQVTTLEKIATGVSSLSDLLIAIGFIVGIPALATVGGAAKGIAGRFSIKKELP